MGDKAAVLKEYFGYERFRPGQERIVDRLASGGDALCVMPTGAGKSVCYQVPALMLPGVTVVISPLISLMKDQVNALTQMGVRAAYINSSLSQRQIESALARAAQGAYKIVYVAPERLAVGQFRAALSRLEVSLVAVDEAHCVSQWGQDFRPSYLEIARFVDALPRRPAVGAFTATATPEVKRDIARMLALKDPMEVTTGFDRPNLYFGVLSPRDKSAALSELVAERAGRSGVVYCATRKAVEEVCDLLRAQGHPATRYHAGLSDEERAGNQDDFVYDRSPIMVATNAFGMGIDKSNVSYVIHYNMPKNLEGYYQEAGRAGRDGERADCLLLYSPKDVALNRYLIDHSEGNPEIDAATRSRIRARERDRLNLMQRYCTTAGCLRAYILDYFGERGTEACGNCSGCAAELAHLEPAAWVPRVPARADITVEAQKILSCVARTGQRFGAAMVADVLRGGTQRRLVDAGLQNQSTYGIMRDVPEARIRAMIDALVADGFALSEADAEGFEILKLGPRAGEVLFRGAKAEMSPPAAVPDRPEKPRRRDRGTRAPHAELYRALTQLRSAIAAEAHLPAYIVFTDASLAEMSKKAPRTREEFLEIAGVGRAKLERYGDRFLEVIARHAPPEPEPGANLTLAQRYERIRRRFVGAGGESAGKPWTDAEDAALRREVSLGYRVDQICRAHGRTRGAIGSRMKKLGISLDD